MRTRFEIDSILEFQKLLEECYDVRQCLLQSIVHFLELFLRQALIEHLDFFC